MNNIGNYAFYGCSNLADVYCYAENVPTTGKDVFKEIPLASSTLHVPKSSVDLYRNTEPWSGFGNIVALTDDDPTGIVKVGSENNMIHFDLQGRMTTNPRNGIYIKDGKKLLLK